MWEGLLNVAIGETFNTLKDEEALLLRFGLGLSEQEYWWFVDKMLNALAEGRV